MKPSSSVAILAGLVLLVALSTPVSAFQDTDGGVLQSFEFTMNVLQTQRQWIPWKNKPTGEPETWLKPIHQVTHLTGEITHFQRVMPFNNESDPDFALFVNYLRANAKEIVLEVGFDNGKILTPYVNRNGSVKGPLKIKGHLEMHYGKTSESSPNTMSFYLGKVTVLEGTQK